MTVAGKIFAMITREFQIINLIEAGLWIVLGLGAMVISLRRRGRVRRDLLLLSLVLIAFGLSDVVETRTGAWWRPWWLLAWKSTCLVVILGLFLNHLRHRFVT